MINEPGDNVKENDASCAENLEVIGKQNDEKFTLTDSEDKMDGKEEKMEIEEKNSKEKVEDLEEKLSEDKVENADEAANVKDEVKNLKNEEENVMDEEEQVSKETSGDIKDKEEDTQSQVEKQENEETIDKPSNYPDFATIFSFLSLFGGYLDLPDVTIMDLEQLLSLNYQISTDKDSFSFLELVYLKLFRRLRQSQRFSYLGNVTAERLERTMAKFSYQLKFDHADKLAINGYQNLNIEERLVMLKNLCEMQFEDNIKFRALFQDIYKGDAVLSLRQQPFGVEKHGFFIWYHEDKECNVRVYAGGCGNENIDEWQVRASSFEDLEQYIFQLKIDTEINPKDTAAERAQEMKAIKEIEKEKRRLEREERRNAQLAQKKNEKRKSRRSKKKETVIPSESSEEEEDDDGCIKCQKNHEDDLVLLCDGCDGGYHASCLIPPLMSIPEGDWFCPFCQQVELVKKLQQKLTELKSKLKAKERKSRRLQFYGIRQANILSEEVEGGNRRSRSKVDYNFSEFDRILDDAVRSSEEDSTSSKPRRSNGVTRTSSGRTTKKRYTLSADEATDSGDDYLGSDSQGSGGRSDDFVVSDDYDEMEERHRNKYLRRSKRTTAKYSSANRSQRKRRRNRYDSDEEDSDEDEESDYGPRRSSRIQRKGTHVKYDELYGSDLDEEETGKKVAGKDDDFKKDSESEVEEEDDVGNESKGDESGSDTSHCFSTKRSKKQVIESDESEEEEEKIEETKEEEKIEETKEEEKIEETKEETGSEKANEEANEDGEKAEGKCDMEIEKTGDSVDGVTEPILTAANGENRVDKEQETLEKAHDSEKLKRDVEISYSENLELKHQVMADSKDVIENNEDTKPLNQNDTFPAENIKSAVDSNDKETAFVNGTCNKVTDNLNSQNTTPKRSDIANTNTDSKTTGFRPYNSNPSAMEIKKYGISPQPSSSSQVTHPSHPSRRLHVYQPRHLYPQQYPQQIHRPQQTTNPSIPSSLPTYYEANSSTHNRFPMYHPQRYPYAQQQHQQQQHQQQQHQQQQHFLHNQPKPQMPTHTYGNNYPSVPTRNFYAGGVASPYQNQWAAQNPSAPPHSQWPYPTPHTNFMKEQANDEVKKKGREKETKGTVKRTANKPNNKSSSLPNQNEATRSMNYFRNMVISADDNNRYQNL